MSTQIGSTLRQVLGEYRALRERYAWPSWSMGEAARTMGAGRVIEQDMTRVGNALARGALGCAAQALGLAQRMVDISVQYTSERQQFGQGFGVQVAVAGVEDDGHQAGLLERVAQDAMHAGHRAQVNDLPYPRLRKQRLHVGRMAEIGFDEFHPRIIEVFIISTTSTPASTSRLTISVTALMFPV